MEDNKLSALYTKLKSGAPKGRTGGLGSGFERARVAIGSNLPDNPLYRNFVRAGTTFVEEELKSDFAGKKEKFADLDSDAVATVAAAASDDSTTAATAKAARKEARKAAKKRARAAEEEVRADELEETPIALIVEETKASRKAAKRACALEVVEVASVIVDDKVARKAAKRMREAEVASRMAAMLSRAHDVDAEEEVEEGSKADRKAAKKALTLAAKGNK
jgi:hypothetical protein